MTINKYLLLLCALQLTLQANFTVFTFEEWKARFNITYPNATEDARRQQLYNANLAELLNSTCTSCGITKFAADSPEEDAARTNLLFPSAIQQRLTVSRPSQKQMTKLTDDGSGRLVLMYPTQLDWRKEGKVTPVKDQGDCGNCWSFATVAMFQSLMILQGRDSSPDFSEQFLLKCTPFSSCDGGYLTLAIDKALGGLPSQEKYPYDQNAHYNGICSTSDLTKVSDKRRVTKYDIDDNQLIKMLQDGPIAVQLSASGWKYYTSGVYQCSNWAWSYINHGALLVGYTDKYWIIKNSWGSNWGQDGYIYVTRDAYHNCGIGAGAHTLAQNFHILTTLILVVILCIL